MTATLPMSSNGGIGLCTSLSLLVATASFPTKSTATSKAVKVRSDRWHASYGSGPIECGSSMQHSLAVVAAQRWVSPFWRAVRTSTSDGFWPIAVTTEAEIAARNPDDRRTRNGLFVSVIPASQLNRS